ncbi:MAG: caspase family protein [Rhodobacteraceae bacterium]|nr:caspase family protein [Paracoccaceae bacterium]
MKYLFVTLLYVLLAHPAWAAKLALVIGNSQYAQLQDLKNPTTDAEGYRDVLSVLGYDVTFHTDLDRFGMEDAIIDFADRIRDGDEAFVVFSGHGWSDGSVNYLLATDSPLSGSERKLKRYSFALKNGYNGLLDELALQGAGLQVAVVDACRDNPFKPPEGSKNLGIGRGLSRLQPPEGAFVVFSAGAGEVALDRLPSDPADEKFSVFTRHFLPLLNSGLTLEDAVSLAQTQTAELAAQIGHRQRPSYYDETLGKTCLAGECHDLIKLAALNAAKPSQCDRLYEEAKSLDGCFGYESYLAQCADHDFASIAKTFVARQCVQVEAEPEPDPNELARIAKVQRCDALYNEAKDLGACFGYESYVAECEDHAFWGIANGYLDRECQAPQPEPQPDPAELARLAEANRCKALYQEAKDLNACFAYESYVSSCSSHDFAALANGYIERECREPEIALDAQSQKLIDIRRCDTLAASPFDPARPSDLPGVEFDALQVSAALPACQNASVQATENPRMSFAVGRILEAAGDLSAAKAEYSIAASKGYAAAHTALGRFARDGRAGDKDIAEALRRFETAATAGDPAAMTMLSRLYEGDAGLARQDFGKAIDYITQAADLNYPRAFRELGRIYAKGTLFQKDAIKSFENYEKAAAHGDPHARYELGLILLRGDLGIDRNPLKALEYFQAAADQGDVSAQQRLASLYHYGVDLDGTGTKQTDPKKALHWYEEAAHNGSANAQVALARIFENGSMGTPRDLGEALKYYEMAAEQDFLQGLELAAGYYESGEAGVTDPQKAAKYWIRAVELGSRVPVRDREWKRETALELQRQLKAKGHYGGAIDGAIGPGTRRALKGTFDQFHRFHRYDPARDVLKYANFGWDCQC